MARGFGLSLLLLLALGWSDVARSADESQEDQLKAAYLFNFAKFVEWSPGRFETDESPIEFGVIGDRDFHEVLKSVVDGRSVGGRAIQVNSYRILGGAEDCHLLFLGQEHPEMVPEMVDFLRGAGVLTVGEMEGFAVDGGMINFYLDGNKVRFEINEDAAREGGVKISSRLLKLARIVSTKED